MSIYLDDIETPSQRLLRVAAPEESAERLGITDLRPNVYAAFAKTGELSTGQSLGMLIGGPGPEAVGFAPSPCSYAVLVEAESAKSAFLRALARVCTKRFNIVHGGQRFIGPFAGTPGDERLALEPLTVLVCKGPTPSSPPVVVDWSCDASFDFRVWTLATLGEVVMSAERDFVDEEGAAFFAAADAAEREHRSAFDAEVEHDREARDYARDE
jgi:hypothetical protein